VRRILAQMLETEAGRTSAEVDRTPWFVPAGQADRPG